MAYTCEECGGSSPKLSQLLQHRREENHWKKFSCDVCGKVFHRKDNLDRQVAKHKQDDNYHCDQCGKVFYRLDNLTRHKEQKHVIGSGQKRPADRDDGNAVKRFRAEADPRQFYTISKVKEQKMAEFRTVQSTYKVTFRDIEVTDDILNTLRTLFTTIFADLTTGMTPSDLIRLVVHSSSLDFPIVIQFGPIPTLTADRFMSEIERVLQSNEDFVIDDSLIFEVTHVDMPIGGSRKRCKYANTNKFLLDKRCIIRINNDDDMCCARAIVTAKAKFDQHEKWNSIRLGKKAQEQLAVEIHEQAGVAKGKCGMEEVKRFQNVLTDYQIHVMSADHFNAIIYAGPEADRKLYLYYHDNHYDVITSMAAFLSRSFYCTKCNSGYEHKDKHACNNVCPACHKIHDAEEANISLHCGACNRFFRGQKCFELHKKTTQKGKSTCEAYYRCKECGKTVNRTLRKKHHVCGEKYCTVCKEYVVDGHRCYMMPEDPKPKDEKAKTFS